MTERLRASVGKRPELVALLAFAVVACVLLLVLKLGSEAMEGETKAFDVAILTGLRRATEGDTAWRPVLRVAMLDLTALGDTVTLVLVVAMVTGYLALARQRGLAVSLVVATVSGAMVTTVLKALIERPRPDLVAHLTSFGGASFPSGHAMNSAVTYLTLAVLIAGAVQGWRLRVYVLGCAVLLTIVVGGRHGGGALRRAQRAKRPWLVQLLARREATVAAVALANKNARMIWAMMTSGERYREPQVA